jgi:hypothetical protein
MSIYNRYGPAQRQWYAQPARGVSYASAGANMRFGEFLKTQVVTHEAKAFSRQKVEKLENRDTSDGSDGGPCWSALRVRSNHRLLAVAALQAHAWCILNCAGDYERDPSKKAGQPGSCRPKKKKDKDKKDGVEKKKHDAAAVPGKGGIHAAGADADGDGKKGEGKKKGSWKGDHDGDKVPDAIDKDYTSDGSVSYTSSSSDDEGKMTKSKANASAADSDGSCGCGCSSKNSSKKENGCGGLKKTISKASASDGKKHKSGKIYRSRDGKHGKLDQHRRPFQCHAFSRFFRVCSQTIL